MFVSLAVQCLLLIFHHKDGGDDQHSVMFSNGLDTYLHHKERLGILPNIFRNKTKKKPLLLRRVPHHTHETQHRCTQISCLPAHRRIRTPYIMKDVGPYSLASHDHLVPIHQALNHVPRQSHHFRKGAGVVDSVNCISVSMEKAFRKTTMHVPLVYKTRRSCPCPRRSQM